MSPLIFDAAIAQTPNVSPTFEAKRVKAPQRGSRPKIDVQIVPDTGSVAPMQDTQTADKVPSSGELGQYSWFWDAVSPDLDQASAGRIEVALHTIAARLDDISAPRLDDMLSIAQAHRVNILLSTVGTNVSPALVLAVIAVESSGRVDAESSAGAQGLMQLMPATAQRFGVENRLSAPESIAGGVKYLDWLMNEFDQDPILALAAYNAGEGAVRRNSGVPLYPETRNYVPKVVAAFQVARGLCQTPPQLASDGCVFVLPK
ncbi:MAG: lytic transglycosylase domain-containing protein [Paracoccaceae bacterium]